MTNKETVEHKINLTFDFIKEVVKNPQLLDEMKDGSELEFVEKDVSLKPKNGLKKPTHYIKVTQQFETVA